MINDALIGKVLTRIQDVERYLIRYRTGVVTAVSPLTITVGASTTPYVGVRALGSYFPVIGDVVSVLTFGSDLIVMGKSTDGTESTYVQRSKRPVHVKDQVGFVGDGVTSDAAAFAAAYAALPTTGGTLALPAATMIPGTAIQTFQKNGVQVIGEGANASILKQTAATGYLIDVSVSGRQLFKDFCIDGGGVAGTATTTSGSANLTVVTPTTGWANGMSVTGAGIPAGATILSGAGTATMVMSANATASAALVDIRGSVVGASATGVAQALRLNGAHSAATSGLRIANFTNNNQQYVMVLEGSMDTRHEALDIENNGQHLRLKDNAAHTFPSNQSVFYGNCKFQRVLWASGNAIVIEDSEGNLFDGFLCQGNLGINTIAVANSVGGNAPGRGNQFIGGWLEENGNGQAGSHGFHIVGANTGAQLLVGTSIERCMLLSSAHDHPSVQIHLSNADSTYIDRCYSNLGTPNATIGEGSGVTNTHLGDNSFAGAIAALAGNVTAVASATTVTLPTKTNLVSITGTTTITGVTASWAGRRVTLIFTGVLTFTDGSNLKLAGNLVTTADDSITLVSDGTNWIETGRSVN